MAKAKAKPPLLEGSQRKRREIVTPEGVVLSVERADYGERVMAFIIDFCFWMGATLLIYVPAVILIYDGANARLGMAALLFIGFLIRTCYFLHFEQAWQGATPGKRIVGLRVIDRQGGPLLPAAVIARNLTREIEIFLPIGLILSLPDASEAGWEKLITLLWLFILVSVPFLNRDRMRAGDLIGGTMVISLPRRALLADMAEGEFHYKFSDRQLMAYGNYELQVLEELLRRADNLDAITTLHGVGDKIRNKIGWTEPVPQENELLFLHDFYAAERAFLERQQLFGKVKLDKHDNGQARPA